MIVMEKYTCVSRRCVEEWHGGIIPLWADCFPGGLRGKASVVVLPGYVSLVV